MDHPHHLCWQTLVRPPAVRLGLIVLLFLSWRLLLHAVGDYSRSTYPRELPKYSSSEHANVWAVWDSGFYFSIATYGYPQNVFIDPSSWQGRLLERMGRPPEPQDRFSRARMVEGSVNKTLAKAWLAQQDPQTKIFPKTPYWERGWYAAYHFMPMYPYLTALVSNVFGDVVISGIVISNICLLLGALVFYQLLRTDFSDEISQWGALFYVFFPLTCFLGAFLTESFNNCLVFLALLSAKRSRFLLSVVLAAIICLTRLNGFLIFIPLLIVYYRQSSTARMFVMKAIVSVAPAAVLLFLHIFWVYLLSGDFSAISRSNGGWGIHFPSSPLDALRQTFPLGGRAVIDLTTWVLTFALLILGIFWSRARSKPRIPVEYICYGAALFLLYTCSGTLQSSTRYAATNPAVYICIALIGIKFGVQRSLLALSALIALIVMYFWTRQIPQLI